MTHQGELPTHEQATMPVGQQNARSERDLATRFVTLALIVGLLTISLRLIALRGSVASMATNPSILKAAMRAAAGNPISTMEAANLLPGPIPATGFQARAMSEIAQRAGMLTTAEAWLLQGLADPDSAYLSQFELCVLYWNDGQNARARETCRGTKSSAQYWLNRGYIADEVGDRSGALGFFQMASSIDPSLIPAWQQTGHALFNLGRYDEAALAYERALALGSTTSEVIQALGRAYLAIDRPAEARQLFEEGLRRFPNQRGLYMGMAETYRAEGDLDAADSWYAQLLQRWPFDAQGWAARGEAAEAAGQPRAAAEYYLEATKIQPDDVGYWLSLASSAAAGDDYTMATNAYRKAMELRPDDADIWLRSGRFLLLADRMAEARSVFEHVLALEPGNSEAESQLASLNGSTEP